MAEAPRCIAWATEMTQRGVLRELVGLRSGEDATTVRVRGNRAEYTDGPFVDSDEQIDGYAVIDCANLDEALAIALLHPAARAGMIEVRPVRDRGSRSRPSRDLPPDMEE